MPIVVRPSQRRDGARAAEFLTTAPAGPGGAGGADGSIALLMANPRQHVVAVAGDEVVGLALVIRGTGRCAVILPPRLRAWDELLASRLLRAAAAHALQRLDARLIQVLTDAEATGPLPAAIERAGFAQLAVLSYQRRPVTPTDRSLEPPAGPDWTTYSFLRHRRFARAIERTYVESSDCPGLAGLRTVDDAIATHKSTGEFSAKTWHLATVDGMPAGVVLVNAFQGRGELVYLGVAPEFRGRGLGRTLLAQGIRDTAAMGLPQMGLAVDVANAPAMKLYERAGFREVRRRAAWFIPLAELERLGAE